MTERAPGWHPDPKSPTSVRYWDGDEWGAVAPAPPKGVTARTVSFGVAWGLVVVLALVWFIVSNSGPSDVECLTQMTDALTDARVVVDPACR